MCPDVDINMFSLSWGVTYCMKNYLSQFEETIICKIIANLSKRAMLSFLPFFSLSFFSAVLVTLLEKKISKIFKRKKKAHLSV